MGEDRRHRDLLRSPALLASKKTMGCFLREGGARVDRAERSRSVQTEHFCARSPRQIWLSVQWAAREIRLDYTMFLSYVSVTHNKKEKKKKIRIACFLCTWNLGGVGKLGFPDHGLGSDHGRQVQL